MSSVAFSRDGRLVASCSWDDTIRVWDVATGSLLKVLDLHDQERCCRLEAEGFAFLHGSRIVFSFGQALWIWSPESDEPLRFADRRAEQVRVFDSGAVTYEHRGSRIDIWDGVATKIVRTLTLPGVELVRPAVSPCGRFFAFLKGSDRVVVIRLGDGSTVREITVPRCWHEADLSFSASGSLLGYAGGDEAPMVFETDTGRRVAALGAPKHSSVGFGVWYHGLIRFADDTMVITAGDDGGAQLWNLPEAREEVRLAAPGVPTRQTFDQQTANYVLGVAAHAGWIRDIAVAPGGDLLASAGDDHVVRLWDVRTGVLLRVLGEPRNTIHALAAQRDWIATGHENGSVRLWDVRVRRLMGEATGHSGRVNGLGFARGDSLVSSGSDGCVGVWRLPNLESLRAFPRERASIQALVMSPDRVTMVTGGWREREGKPRRAGEVTFLNVETGETGPPIQAWGEVPTRTCGGWWDIDAMAMHPSGKLLATAVGCEIRLWHTDTGVPAATLVTRRSFWEDITSLAFSPDGNRLVAGTLGCSLYVWDIGTLGLLLEFRAMRDCIGAIAFTPDSGSLIVLTSYDNTVWIHDAATGKLVETLHAHRASLRALAVSGNLLAMGGQDGSIQLWSIGCWKNLGSLWHPSSAKPERDPA